MKPQPAAPMAAALSAAALACAPLVLAPLVFAPLAACRTLSASQAAATAQTRASQALFVAEAAFEAASAALERASDQGLLKGPDAAKARELYGRAHAALLAARRAKAEGDYALELVRASDSVGQAARVQDLAGAGGSAAAPDGGTP